MGYDEQGKRPVVPEGWDSAASTQLALRDDHDQPSGRSTRMQALLGMLWCLVGSAFVPLVQVGSNMLIAFGFASIAGAGHRRERVAALLLSLAAGGVITTVLTGVYTLPMTMVSVLCAYGVACAVVEGKLRTNGLVALAFSVTCAMLGTDVVSTSARGTSINEVIANAVNEVVETSMSQLSVEDVSAVLESRDQVMAYWPTLYFAVSAGMVLLSLAGAVLGARSIGRAPQSGMISRFDAPLWVGILFAVGAVAEMLASHLPSWQHEATIVGANLVMITRLVLAQQGISVLLWWLRERHASGAIKVMSTLVALWVELSFALTSVVGLVDLAVNFRHIKRGRADLVLGSAKEG